jgi:phenylpyruvate tautomerase PptA (4-oxalocrotonate tautomerase family)
VTIPVAKGILVPLVKVHLREGRSVEQKEAIGAAIQDAIVDVLGIPDADRYQLFTEYRREDFRHTDGYLGVRYSEQLLIIEVAFVEGRSDELKKSLLGAINERLVATGAVHADDVFVVITEFGPANVSFGRGLAQRAR